MCLRAAADRRSRGSEPPCLQSPPAIRRKNEENPESSPIWSYQRSKNNWVDDGRFLFILSLAEIPGPFRTAATPGIPSPQHHRHLPDLKWVINADSLASGCPVAGLGDPPKASDAALFTPPTPPPSHLSALGPRMRQISVDYIHQKLIVCVLPQQHQRYSSSSRKNM